MFLKKFLLFGLLAAVLPAVAEEAADRKTATSLKYVTHELDTRQNKFTAEQNKAMEYTNTAGDVQKRAVTSDLDNGGTDSLPMVGGVNTKLNQKQDDIAAVNDHTAVTYTGQPGGIGRKGIYQTTGTYADQSDNLIDAKTFNAALKTGLDNEFKCKEFKPDTNLCWVYSIHNPTEVRSPNLFDVSTSRIAQVGVLQEDGGYRIVRVSNMGIWSPNSKVIFNGEPNTRYTLSAKLKNGTARDITLGWFYADGSISLGTPRGNFTDYTTVKAVSAAGQTVVGFGAAYNNDSGHFYLKDIQIELGTTATPYMPYGANIYVPQNQ